MFLDYGFMTWHQQHAGTSGLGLASGGQHLSVLNEKQLTSAIKNATTAERLQQLAVSHQGHMNSIHVAAILTKLANLTKAQPHYLSSTSQQPLAPGSSSVHAREALVRQLQDLLKFQRCMGHCPRGLANIIWALGKMQKPPDPELVIMLLRRFYGQLAAAVPQDIANVLWGVAQITRDHGLICPPGCKGHVAAQDAAAAASGGGSSVLHPFDATLAPAEAAETATAAAGGKVCNYGVVNSSQTAAWTTEKTSNPLQQVHPADQPHEGDFATSSSGVMQPLLTVQQVQQLLQHLCILLQQAAPQTISNIMCAICVLQHCHNWCMCCCLPQIKQLVTAFVSTIEDSLPSHIHKVVKCLAQLSIACAGHAKDEWISWQPAFLQVMLSHMVTQHRTLKYFHIVSVLRDVTQLGCLFLPLEITTEVAALSAVAARKAAAAAGPAASAVAAHQLAGRLQEAGRDVAAALQLNQEVLLAVAAAAAAVDDILGVKVFDEADDDSGLPSSSMLMAAAAEAATTAAEAATTAAEAAATAAEAHPQSIVSSSATGSAITCGEPGTLPHGSSAADSIANVPSEPTSPSMAIVRQIVSRILQRLALDDAAQRTTAEDEQHQPHAASPTDARVHAVGGENVLADITISTSAGSGSPVLQKLLLQLEQLGLLQQFTTLRTYSYMQSSGVTGIRAPVAIAARLQSSSYPMSGMAARPDQPESFTSSAGITDQLPHMRQQLSWQQRQQHHQAQRVWEDSRQPFQHPPREHLQHRPGAYVYVSDRAAGTGGTQSGLYGIVEGGSTGPQQQPQRQQPVVAERQHDHVPYQQQRFYKPGVNHQPPPPPHQGLQQQSTSVMGDTIDHARPQYIRQESMMSPFECSGAAAVAVATTALSGGPLPGTQSLHSSSTGSSRYAMQLPLMSSKASTSSSLSHMVESGSIASVPSTRSGHVVPCSPGQPGSSGDRMRHQHVPQMSAALSSTPSSHIRVRPNFPTSPDNTERRSFYQQQQQYMKGSSSSAATGGMLAASDSCLSSHTVQSMQEPPGLVRGSAAQGNTLGTATQRQQQLPAVAQSVDSGVVIIVEDGQQVQYRRMADGTLVPLHRQQQHGVQEQRSLASIGSTGAAGGAVADAMVVSPQPQQAQALQYLRQQQMQRQQELAMAQGAVGGSTAYNLASGSGNAGIMPAAQQQQQAVLQQQQQQQLLQYQQQQGQILQLQDGQLVYYVPEGSSVDTSLNIAGTSVASSLMPGPASQATVQLQYMGEAGSSNPAVAMVSEGPAGYAMVNQGQLMMPQQQQLNVTMLQHGQQFVPERQFMQHQQLIGPGMGDLSTSAGMLQVGVADGSAVAQQFLLQQQAMQQPQTGQQHVYYVLPSQNF